MVQLPNRAPLRLLVNLRKTPRLSPTFEFKYHTAATSPKEHFFKDVQSIQFRVRAVVLNKSQLGLMWQTLSPQDLTMELIVQLTFRASELDIANEVLIINEPTPVFCRHLCVQLTERCKQRIRPFKNIVGANSRNKGADEDPWAEQDGA